MEDKNENSKKGFFWKKAEYEPRNQTVTVEQDKVNPGYRIDLNKRTFTPVEPV